MIIIGYPGIGKSTLVEHYKYDAVKGKLIDLESSMFHNDDYSRRTESNWEDTYCKVAVELDRQGYNVFMSAHEGVRKYLLRHITPDTFVVVCYPSLELKSEWLRRLRGRLQYGLHPDQEHKDKDARALMRAIDEYDHDIESLHNSGYEERVITSMDYNLEELVSGLKLEEEEK
jgi:hypothetical protein